MKMRPIPVEDREKIIKHKTNAKSVKNIAKWLMIGSSTVYQILALHKKTSTIKPKPYKGNNHKITTTQDTKICQTIKKTPDITLNELITTLNLKITESGLCKHLKKQDSHIKKDTTTKQPTTRRHYQSKKHMERNTKKVRHRQTWIFR